MSEYELIYLASEYLNRTWSLLQFWASISFGLIAVAYFASKHLHLAMVITLTILYLAFTAFISSIIGLNEHIVAGFMEDLAALNTLSQGATNLFESAPGPVMQVSIVVVYFGTCFGVLFFLWYSYILSRKNV